MTFNPRLWTPVAWVLCLVNLVGVWLAATHGEPWDASAHAVLALLFGLWAQRLRSRARAG